ncbi:MAG TPA: hypothetical protein VLA52_01825, partial [Thermohalobaculum sp.]|nr:hypothetical protein [Thermohalobaculum sp.]
DFSDSFRGEADFASNGTDTIWFYDGDASAGVGATADVVDIIDLSKALDFVDTDLSGTVDQSEMEAQLLTAFTYNSGTGALQDGASNTWFNVYSDAGGTAAGTVYAEVDGDRFMWDGAGWDMLVA